MRLALYATGLLLLGLAVAVTPRLEVAGKGILASLGRSLGGASVLAVDGLFLRADRLRAAGRPEEVPALYRAALQLDPDNAVAADFLASVLAVDLLNEAPDDEERMGWWSEAWALVERARARHPQDASLTMRAADLLLEVPARHPGLPALVERVVPNARREGLRLLLEAARLTPTLPRRGRQHLEWIAFLLPVAAAEAGPGAERGATLTAGREILELRRATLAEVLTLKEGEDGEPVGIPLLTILERGIEAVDAFDRAERAGDDGAQAASIRALEADWPELPLVEVLRSLSGVPR